MASLYPHHLKWLYPNVYGLFSLVWYLICSSSGNQTWQWKNPHEWCYHWISLKHPSSSGIFHCHVLPSLIFDLCGWLLVLFPRMPCVSFFSKAYFISAKLVPESPGFFRDPRLPVRWTSAANFGGLQIYLKHISQWEGLSHILWKIKNVWNHQPDIGICHYFWPQLSLAQHSSA